MFGVKLGLMKEIKKNVVLSYFFTVAFTIAVLLIVVYRLNVYPFGDNAYLWTDADQYFAIEHYFGTISGVNDIFYSWGNVLGGNALSQLAYYSFSPYNIIFILFNNHMIFAAHAVAYLKILSSAISFCFCLSYFYDDENYLMKSLLSTSYAFMGYMVFYGWNVSWMDGVIMLPLMLVGLYKIVNKKNILLYVVSLTFALISNFYIGFMLCVMSFIFYISITLMVNDKFGLGIKKTIFKYGFASLICGGFCAFLLIPTYLSLPSSRKLSLADIFNGMYLNIKPADILSGLFTGQINTLDGNAPLIYVGAFVVVLDILFFISGKICLKKKMISAAVLLTFVFSFQNSFINKIWHGLSNNAWFNYRYSFAFSFVLLLMAYEAYILVREDAFGKRDYIFAGGLLLTVALFVMQNANEKIQMLGLSYDILFVGIVIVLLVRRCHKYKPFKVFLAVGMVLSLVCNSNLYLKGYGLQSISAYGHNKEIMLDAFQTINDSSFYRMDKSFQHGRCDGNLFNYRGISNYASTENLENENFIKRLGVQHSWMHARYNTNLPIATESLLGIKYILTNTINGKDYEQLGNYNDITYYRNPYALPIIFGSNSIDNFSLEDMSDFDILNTIWKSMSGLDENVFEENITANDSEDNQKILNVSVVKSGSAYLYVPDGTCTALTIYGMPEDKVINYTSDQEIYYIGELNEGDSLQITIETDDENYNVDNIKCCIENREEIKKISKLVNQQNLSIREISSSHLAVEYAGQDKVIITTIPFDEGWRIYDDGKEVTTEKNWNNFVAFQLDDSDEHHIEMIYRPVGYSFGAKMGIASGLLLLLYEIVEFKKSRKKRTLMAVQDLMDGFEV